MKDYKVGEERKTDPEAIARPGFGDEVERPRVHKAAGAFRTISEVADELHVPQHVLRFWESKFPQVRPLKRGGGRRYYRPEDVVLLRRVADLLYTQGYTIKGVQRLLRDQGEVSLPSRARELPEPASLIEAPELLQTKPIIGLEPMRMPDLIAEQELQDSMVIAPAGEVVDRHHEANEVQYLRGLLRETLEALEQLRRAIR